MAGSFGSWRWQSSSTANTLPPPVEVTPNLEIERRWKIAQLIATMIIFFAGYGVVGSFGGWRRQSSCAANALPPPVEVISPECCSLAIFPTFRPAAQRKHFTSLAAEGSDYAVPSKKLRGVATRTVNAQSYYTWKLPGYLHRWR